MKRYEIDDSEDHITREALEETNLRVIPPGSLLMVVRGMILAHSVPVALTIGPVTINQDMKALRCVPEVDPRFLRAAFQGAEPWLVAQAEESAHGTKRLESDALGRFEVPLPDLREQRAIADYLDREIARLDDLVVAKERLLELLAEKRRALITRAVTRGLDPYTPRRDSGIPWLGEVPAHWEVERARWLFAERDQRSETGDEELLTVSHLTGVTPRSEKAVYMFEAESTEGYKICLRGDLVINTLWAWMGAMGVSSVDGIVSPAYNVYRPSEDLHPLYVDALVRLPVFAHEVTRYSKGVWSSRLRLYPEGFFEVFLPCPPIAEQEAIVEFVRIETRKIDSMHIATRATISLLKERRAALIAAAVTGQIDLNSDPQLERGPE
jgi:type I restriction enzyme S subunit